MKFRTEYLAKSSQHSINHDHVCILMGSCFVENVGQKMRDHGFSTVINPTGILYNPASLAKMISTLHGKTSLDTSRFVERQDHTFHYDFHSDFHAKSEDSFSFGLEQIQSEFQRHWKNTKTLILTLGTAWVYDYDDAFVANCHKQNSGKFEKRLLSISEIQKHLRSIYQLCNDDQIKLICTVSPVRHIKDGIVENQRSKAHLLSAIHSLKDTHSDVEYFPSYEILQDDLRDYRYFDNDLVHPNQQAVEYIWQKFRDTYFADETLTISKEAYKIRQMQNHRPLFPESEEAKQFQKQLADKISVFQKNYPKVRL